MKTVVVDGRELTYREYLRSDAWRVQRRHAIERAGWRCQLCAWAPKFRGTTTGFNVHHNSYENLGHEKPEDLTCLCGRCHKEYHDKKRDPKKVSAKTVRQSLSKKARQFVRQLNLEPQAVCLTASERRRRAAYAVKFISGKRTNF